MEIELFYNKICEEYRYREERMVNNVDLEKEHGYNVFSWAEKLSGDVSPALKLATLFHDIDRIVTKGIKTGYRKKRNTDEYREYKKRHAKRSADYTYSILKKEEQFSPLADRVSFLISHHDDILEDIIDLNDKEVEVLVASDTFGFFNIFAEPIYEKEGSKRVKDKIYFMIRKLSPPYLEILRDYKVENENIEEIKNEVIKEHFNLEL